MGKKRRSNARKGRRRRAKPLAISLLAGAGPWLMTNAAPLLNAALEVVAIVFAMSLVIQLVLAGPLWLAHRGLSRLTHSDIR